MMPAVKHLDPVLGLDIHFILMVTPVGPLPIPLPNPFIGIVFDVMDYIPFIGSTVWVNGLPSAIAGTGGFAIPHLPLGGPLIKPSFPPQCEMFMGSATVSFSGEPATYSTLLATSCSDIGIPPIPRFTAKKRTKLFSMVLPTSIALGIPMGMPVLIGGPPVIAMLQKIEEALEGGSIVEIVKDLAIDALKDAVSDKLLGKALDVTGKAVGGLSNGLKKLMRLRKKNNRVKRRVKKARRRSKKKMKKLGVQRRRNKVCKSKCTKTGHPVDVATGKVFTDNIDFELPGPIPFVWERTWYSTSTYQGPLGHGWHHSYDMEMIADHESVAIRMSDGRAVAFPPLAPGEEFFERLEKLTLLRDESGYGLKDNEGLIHRFDRIPNSSLRKLIRIEDGQGNYIRFVYTPSGGLYRIFLSNGVTIEARRDFSDRIIALELEDPNNPEHLYPRIRYRYDLHGNLSEAIDPSDNKWSFIYENHLLKQETNRNDLSFYFEYDGSDHNAKCLRTWGDGGIYDHKLTYYEGAKKTIVENSLGHKTVHHLADSGLVIKSIDPKGNESSIEYNEFNEPMVETDELNRYTRYEYDDYGNATTICFPDYTIIKVKYEKNRPVEAIDTIGGKWEWEYDEQERLIKKRDPQKRFSEYRYEENHLIEFIDPAGGVTRLEYDDRENVTAMVAPDETKTQWEYDSLNRITTVIDPNGNKEIRSWNQRDLLNSIQEPDGNHREFFYDREENLIHARDRHYEVEFSYAGMGRMTSRRQNGTKVDFIYDTEEQLRAIRNEHGLLYQFELDENGEILIESGFDGLRRKYHRDALGRVQKMERPGDRFSEYQYNDSDQVIRITHSDGEKEQFKYREDGELMEAKNSATKVKFERDELGQVLRECQDNHWIDSIYNELGLRIEMRSSKGAIQKIERNLMGDTDRVTYTDKEQKADAKPLWQVNFVRDQLGQELERSLPGGLKSVWKRDRLGRPITHIIDNTKSYFRTRGYSWDVNNRITQISDSLRGITGFHHDRFGNLTKATMPTGEQLLRMPNAVGNLFRSQERTDRVYGKAGELLEAQTEKGVTRYQYDSEGNLIKKVEGDGSEWQYNWNSSGMLKEVVRPDNSVVVFTYDPLGRRIAKSHRGKTTHWLWDGNFMLHEWQAYSEEYLKALSEKVIPFPAAEVAAKQRETLLAPQRANAPPATSGSPESNSGLAQTDHKLVENSESELTTWLFEPESYAPMAKIVGDKQYSIINDHLGTPLAMFDQSGNKVWSADLDIYGRVTNVDGNQADCPFRYPGQYEDSETGLYYNRFRYYDPESGQYTSQDPIGLDGGKKLFAYVVDPLSWFDPLGLSACHEKGERGNEAARKQLNANGFKEVEKEVTMIVNGSRIRADLVYKKANTHGKMEIFVIEVKNGKSRLTKNQKKAGVFDMKNPANSNDIINVGKGKQGSFRVDTDEKIKVAKRGKGPKEATFLTLCYDV